MKKRSNTQPKIPEPPPTPSQPNADEALISQLIEKRKLQQDALIKIMNNMHRLLGSDILKKR